MSDIIHVFGNHNSLTSCGLAVTYVGEQNVTNNMEACTCTACLKYIIRDALNRFLILDSR